LGFVVGEGDAGRQESALLMAQELNCVVVLKGFHTVVASPEGLVVVDELAGPELATAGSGDVLAGLIGSMLASWEPQSYNEVVEIVFKAISAHALAARAAAEVMRPVTSPDILNYLPRVLRQ
jgi:NAD(P)H-hydrate repair Nnr-like enzyme with NAD(P)H-hydrate dehydratase domain